MCPALMADRYVRWLKDEEAEALISAGLIYRCGDSTRCGFAHRIGVFLHPINSAPAVGYSDQHPAQAGFQP